MNWSWQKQVLRSAMIFVIMNFGVGNVLFGPLGFLSGTLFDFVQSHRMEWFIPTRADGMADIDVVGMLADRIVLFAALIAMLLECLLGWRSRTKHRVSQTGESIR